MVLVFVLCKIIIEDLCWLFGVCVCLYVYLIIFFLVYDCELFGEEIVFGLCYIEEYVGWFDLFLFIDMCFVCCEDMIDLVWLMYFDIEIMGLVGGIGICVFMIGVVDWCVGCLWLC